DAVDMRSFLYRPAHAGGHRWADMARRRMRADYLRLSSEPPSDLTETYRNLIEEYDRGGLPWERAVTRLSLAQWLREQGMTQEAEALRAEVILLARRYGMQIVEADALTLWEGAKAARP